MIKKRSLLKLLPDALRGAEIGSFAHYTITVRLPAIGRRVLEENELHPLAQRRVQELTTELPAGLLRPLQDPGAPDLALWDRYLQPYLGMDWLAIPWFLAETYFYRRVLEAVGYFQPGPGFKKDPYAFQKQMGLEAFRDLLKAVCTDGLIRQKDAARSLEAEFIQRLSAALWGNQADLSMWPAGEAERPDHPAEARRFHLLCDDSYTAAQYLLNFKIQRVDMILDNCGLELVQDLLLADFLLENGLAQAVCLHAKPYPTFVSDATQSDINQTVAFLVNSVYPEVRLVGQRLQSHITASRLQVLDHFFWVSPLAMWDLPPDLSRVLGKSGLLISKGDANYRRFLGDRHWPFDTSLRAALGYLSRPWLGLRVSKSQVMVGLRPGQAAELDMQDKDWLTNGRWGLIQFFDPSRGKT